MKCLKFLLFAVLGLFLFGCTAAGKSATTDTASMEWRVKSLEESFLNFREKQRQMADEVVEDRDRLDQRVTDLEEKVAGLRNGTSVAVPTEETPEPPAGEGWVTDLKPEDDGWVKPEGATEPPVAQSGEDKPWADVPKPPATIPEPEVVKRKTAPKPAPMTASRPKAKISGAQALYAKGYKQYSMDNMEGARATFDQFLAKYPSDALAANALYWKGETYYSEKDFAQAILTFKEVTGRFPKHHKSAAALLKIGMAYDRVGDRDNAIFYLRALIEDFPNSDEAGLGRKELTRLGG
ncbi:tol-pal system protein YbgF [Pseudodesulfovibrio portus]|uniref:Tol-pal system protein YbgF n=1 Tax=Pseudodesulfovibrio portus TaxID=231439 RepID=A0ABM8AVQ7_9BACT|nr:tol-pal system protein YbgF [Pseudodesulfovibrio portus]BDQ35620.1 tol-pal system protein YbgF [Pseudodesulfovibrio portus]